MSAFKSVFIFTRTSLRAQNVIHVIRESSDVTVHEMRASQPYFLRFLVDSDIFGKNSEWTGIFWKPER